jgi:hypothetical protein
LSQIKAVVTDYIGTLTNARSYTMEASLAKLNKALIDGGSQTEKSQFLVAYGKAHEKYRLVRYANSAKSPTLSGFRRRYADLALR